MPRPSICGGVGIHVDDDGPEHPLARKEKYVGGAFASSCLCSGQGILFAFVFDIERTFTILRQRNVS